LVLQRPTFEIKHICKGISKHPSELNAKYDYAHSLRTAVMVKMCEVVKIRASKFWT